MITSRPSVVGKCTSIICIVANFSKALRAVSPGASDTQALGQSDVQTIRQKRHEDVRFDPLLALMKDRPDRQVALEILERLLHVDQLHVELHKLSAGPVSVRLVRSRVAPFSPPHLAQRFFFRSSQ